MRVPILLYHYIRPHPDRAIDPLGFNLSVSPEGFDEQLTYLEQQGYKTIRLADLARNLMTGEPALPPKPVILTFDDGYSDAFTNAFPLLKKHGMIGTFFIPVNFIDQSRANYASWDQLREMAAAGMEIGSHTLNHADLSSRWVSAELEIIQSRRTLEARIGQPVLVFAYPYGKLNLRVEELVGRTYLAAVDSVQGTVHSSEDLIRLHRVQVAGGWSTPQFVYFLNYWLSQPR